MVATCVFVVLVSLLLQPLHRAYAEENTATPLPEPAPEAEIETDPTANEIATSVAEEIPAPESTDGQPTASDIAGAATKADPASTTTPQDADVTTAATTSTSAGDAPEIVPTEVATTSLSIEDTQTSSTATTTPPTKTTATTSPTSIASSSTAATTSLTATGTIPTTDVTDGHDDAADTEVEALGSDTTANSAEPLATTSTTTPPVVDRQSPATTSLATTTSRTVQVTHTNEQNVHQFGRDDCVLAGNGAYYCTQKESFEQYAETGVFAAPDADGDTEIFVRVDGETRQLTENLVDDGSPHYDSVSDRVVWHRLAGDRYQIVAYDFTTEQELLLTDTSYNNMEPVAFGEMIAWQAWRGGDWEIMLYDGEVTVQLTSNNHNDVAPSLYGDFVMWQAQFADGAQLAAYDINTGATKYLTGTDDVTQAQNPRVVLMYDQVDSDGTVATYGYDVESHETIPLGRAPASLPDRLPSPEEPGSEKALVHAQPTARDGDERDAEALRGDDDDTTTATTSTSTLSLVEGDVVVGSTASTSPATTSDDMTDVVVPPAATTTNATSSGASVEHIPEVVVPPLASSSTTVTYDE